MEKSRSAKLQSKFDSKLSQSTADLPKPNLGKQDLRTLFVGDDTGLLKKLRLTVNTT